MFFVYIYIEPENCRLVYALFLYTINAISFEHYKRENETCRPPVHEQRNRTHGTLNGSSGIQYMANIPESAFHQRFRHGRRSRAVADSRFGQKLNRSTRVARAPPCLRIVFVFFTSPPPPVDEFPFSAVTEQVLICTYTERLSCITGR